MKNHAKKLIAQHLCCRCRLNHPGPGCLYRRFREAGVRKLTKQQVDWVWKLFFADPLAGRSRENFEILYSLESEEIDRREAQTKSRLEPFRGKEAELATGAILAKGQWEFMTKDILRFGSDDTKEGMRRARALGKRIGRPKRSGT